MKRLPRQVWLTALIVFFARSAIHAQVFVDSHQKISATEGDFEGDLTTPDFFSFSVASLGDLDGDGPWACAAALRSLCRQEFSLAETLRDRCPHHLLAAFRFP